MALAIKITESSPLMDELLKQTSTGARKANSTAAVPGANAHKAQTLKARQKIGPPQVWDEGCSTSIDLAKKKRGGTDSSG